MHTQQEISNSVEIDKTVVFDRRLQPYGTPHEMMLYSQQRLLDILEHLHEYWGGEEMTRMSVADVTVFALEKYPFENPVYVYTMQQTYIGQLAGIGNPMTAKGMLLSTYPKNARVIRLCKIVSQHAHTHVRQTDSCVTRSGLISPCT